MYKLQTGMILSVLITGIVLLYGFLTSLPDGKLHIVFCNVGQGDATYVRFPDGRDMLIDGGPNDSVLKCLGRYMPFWDRTLDMVALTHAQKDHMNGLVSVLRRYRIGSFAYTGHMPDIGQDQRKTIQLAAGMKSSIGNVSVAVFWPSVESIARQKGGVLGAATDNDTSLVMQLTYGAFTVFLPGDADSNVDDALLRYVPAGGNRLDVLKVPHHGSETAISERLLGKVSPGNSGARPAAVISVGKNSYGHPSPALVGRLKKAGFRVVRTDQAGTIEVVSDGKTWELFAAAVP